jgi:hypothetical protein
MTYNLEFETISEAVIIFLVLIELFYFYLFGFSCEGLSFNRGNLESYYYIFFYFNITVLDSIF